MLVRRLGGDAVGSDLEGGRQGTVEICLHPDLEGRSVGAAYGLSGPHLQGGHQPQIVDGDGTKVVHEASHLVHGGAQVRPHRGEEGGRLGRLGGGGVRGRIRGQDDSGQERSQPVVQVAP